MDNSPKFEQLRKIHMMKSNMLRGILLGMTLFFSLPSTVHGQDENREFYQLRIYTIKNDIQESRVDTYLEQAYLPALKRRNIKNIGVFKFIPEVQDSLRQVFVLLPIASPNELNTLHEELQQDSEYYAKGETFINAPHDDTPYERMESVLLKAFKDMPMMRPTRVEGDRAKRVYELRSYESPTEALFRNKVKMFNEGGEITLFDSLGFNAVFYSEVISGSNMPNLMYMTTFKDMETRDSKWKEFVASAKWKELISDPQYNNNINHIDIHLLYPTPYSDY
jgi:hypothetical protein